MILSVLERWHILSAVIVLNVVILGVNLRMWYALEFLVNHYKSCKHNKLSNCLQDVRIEGVDFEGSVLADEPSRLKDLMSSESSIIYDIDNRKDITHGSVK